MCHSVDVEARQNFEWKPFRPCRYYQGCVYFVPFKLLAVKRFAHPYSEAKGNALKNSALSFADYMYCRCTFCVVTRHIALVARALGRLCVDVDVFAVLPQMCCSIVTWWGVPGKIEA